MTPLRRDDCRLPSLSPASLSILSSHPGFPLHSSLPSCLSSLNSRPTLLAAHWTSPSGQTTKYQSQSWFLPATKDFLPSKPQSFCCYEESSIFLAMLKYSDLPSIFTSLPFPAFIQHAGFVASFQPVLASFTNQWVCAYSVALVLSTSLWSPGH